MTTPKTTSPHAPQARPDVCGAHEPQNSTAAIPPRPCRHALREGGSLAYDMDAPVDPVTGLRPRVAVTWPVSTTPEMELVEALADLGITIPDSAAAVQAIGKAFDEAGDRRAADFLGVLIARLPESRRGDELRAVLLGTLHGENYTETAQRYGITRQSLMQGIESLRVKLLGGTARLPVGRKK